MAHSTASQSSTSTGNTASALVQAAQASTLLAGLVTTGDRFIGEDLKNWSEWGFICSDNAT
jgi:hypothetical protein